MKSLVFFNICKDGDKWRLTGRVVDESISELHETQKECKDRAISILKAYKYVEASK